MNKNELEKEANRSMKEFDLAWAEFFKDKPNPKDDEEDKNQQQEFYQWYNYIRKQSDTGKTPAEMYQDSYGERPPQNFPTNMVKPSRMTYFEWDEDGEEFDETEEERLDYLDKIAEYMFNNGVWQDSKEQMKEMSKRDYSKQMFKLGFFLHDKYKQEQMKIIEEELKTMSKEDIEKMVNLYKEENKNERNL